MIRIVLEYIDQKLKGKENKVVQFILWYVFTVIFWIVIELISGVLMILSAHILIKLKAYKIYYFSCLKCFFWCLEKFMKFINKNAYILVSEVLQKLSKNYAARLVQGFLKKFSPLM